MRVYAFTRLSLGQRPGDASKIAPVLAQFDVHFQPRKSRTYERYKFLTRHQRDGESCGAFLLELQSLIASCEYDAQRDSILRDKIVIGVADNKQQKSYCSIPSLLWPKQLTFCVCVKPHRPSPSRCRPKRSISLPWKSLSLVSRCLANRLVEVIDRFQLIPTSSSKTTGPNLPKPLRK
jgi:hypothetical protein